MTFLSRLEVLSLIYFSLGVSPTGWTDRHIFKHWFLTTFVPEAEKHCVDPDKPIVLTLDSHNSHETRKLICAAYDHNVILIILPSKTIHKLQPLDVGVFSTIQRKWSRHCDEHLAQGVCINCFNFIPEYLTIHHTIYPSLVQKAFSKTGIYPLNPNIFNDNDFAPSQASSSTLTFLLSYPSPHEGLLSAPSEPSEMSGSLGDQDGLGSSNSDHSSHNPFPSTNCITHPAPVMPHLPTLPQLPPYDHIIHQTPKEIWDFMRLHQIQCEKVLKEVTAQHNAAIAHCTIACHQINNLTKQLTNKT